MAIKQHGSPCTECPFKKESLRGWLGGYTAAEFSAMAHGEDWLECHTVEGAQCVGAAIYRANVCKLPRDPAQLRMPSDKTTIIATRSEFIDHHTRKGSFE